MPCAQSLDVEFYRIHHPDLAKLSDKEAVEHYLQYGKKEGRLASALAKREALADRARQASTKLEIGPFADPILTGEGVRYLDILDAEQLRDRAVSIGKDPAGCPKSIDYIGSLEQVTEHFDAVLSAHCIEHQPDLIAHLNGVAAVLKPGGRYFIIIPDKRYCFDHFIAESTVAQVLDAHEMRRQVHSLTSVIEHHALTTHNDPGRHWRGDHGIHPGIHDAMRYRVAIDRYRQAAGGYIDVHAWYFTPDSFRRVIASLSELGISRLQVTAVYETPFDHQEFCAILEVVGEEPGAAPISTGHAAQP